jgi:hypothetical protein
LVKLHSIAKRLVRHKARSNKTIMSSKNLMFIMENFENLSPKENSVVHLVAPLRSP